MAHAIEVQLGANIDKYRAGMQAAKQVGSDTMGTLSTIAAKIKELFGGAWDWLKSFFSGTSDGAKSSFGSMSSSASSAFQKIASYFPGFHSDLDKTKAKMGETEEKSSSLASKIGTALVAAVVAAAVAIGALTAKGLMVDSAYAGIATSTGIAVSQLSRFDEVAARNGITTQQLGESMGKFRDAMKDATKGDGSDEFSKLGIKVKDANGALRNTDDVLIETAKKIAGLSSEAEKYDAASKVAFSGKVQFLQDTANAGTLSARVTDQQAQAVKHLGDVWHEILPSGRTMLAEISDKLTNALTPAMTTASEAVLTGKNKIVDAFNQIYGGGTLFDRLAAKIQEWSKDAAGWFADVTKSASNMTVELMKYVAAKTGMGNADGYKPSPSVGAVPASVPLTSDKPVVVETEAQKAAKQSVQQLNLSMADQIAIMQKQVDLGRTLTQGERNRITVEKSQTLAGAEVTKAGFANADMLDKLEQRFSAIQKAKAADEAASKKQQETYVRVMGTVNARLDQQAMELLSGQDLTESQKQIIKINAEVASGQIKLSQSGLAELQVKLQQIAANDKLLRSQEAQRQVTKYIEESTISRQKQNDALAVEYALYGKTSDARAIAMVAVNSEIWKEQELAKLRADKLPVTEATIARLNQERDARTQVGQATLGQTQALQYAYDLEQENRRYAAEQIVDATASKRALLAIDNGIWKERIANAGDGTEAQKRIAMAYDQWYASRRAEADPWYGMSASLKQYGRDASDVGSQIGNAMTNAFNGAEDAFATFVTTGKLNFSSLATSIIADLARIQAKQAISGIASFLGSTLSSFIGGGLDLNALSGTSASALNTSILPMTGSAVDTSQFMNLDFLPHRANGGPVMGGTSYVVGERGEELFTPSSNGTITPNHALGSGGGDVNINLTTNISGNGATSQGSGDSDSNTRAMGDALNAKMKALITQETRQGGIIWKFQQGRG